MLASAVTYIKADPAWISARSGRTMSTLGIVRGATSCANGHHKAVPPTEEEAPVSSTAWALG